MRLIKHQNIILTKKISFLEKAGSNIVSFFEILRGRLNSSLKVALYLEAVTWRCSIKCVFSKTLCWSIFFNKVAGWRLANGGFIKKDTLAQVFSCEFCKISKNTFLTEHLRTTTSVHYQFHFID